jgi:hypothetical protein
MVEDDGVAFCRWIVEEFSVSEPQADLDEEREGASAFLASAISSSRTFRDNQDGEGGIEE